MDSIPEVGHRVEQLAQIDSSMPSLSEIPPGCAFNPRCSHASDRCRSQRPELIFIADEVMVAHHSIEEWRVMEAGVGLPHFAKRGSGRGDSPISTVTLPPLS